jgi:2,3,4,5-tetrahydropyridine-2-carboxylate N-succinyltransferase
LTENIMTQQLQSIIDNAWDNRANISPSAAPKEVVDAVEHVIAELNDGKLRVATREGVGQWTVHQWIKKAVLLSFRLKDNALINGGALNFFDKVPTKFEGMSEAEIAATGVRVVPPAVARRGSFIAKGAILMPSYVNIGAYVDEGTMVDTWATVGSCAQVGKNVHLSGGVGLGGVLEPLQANPTIIEDNCFIGARSEVVEGVIVEENSVLGMGVYIGQSTLCSTAKPAKSPTAACPAARWWSAATCPSRPRMARTTPCMPPSSSSAWMHRPAPRPASTTCCATDGPWPCLLCLDADTAMAAPLTSLPAPERAGFFHAEISFAHQARPAPS